MKAIYEKIRTNAVCIVIIVLGCIGMNIIAYCLPMKRIQYNINRSSQVFATEGDYYTFMDGYPQTCLNNWSEAGMILRAAYNGKENIIEKAFGGYFERVSNKEHTESLIYFANGESGEEVQRVSYSRYWHGYIL